VRNVIDCKGPRDLSKESNFSLVHILIPFNKNIRICENFCMGNLIPLEKFY
jgi:hypothetical protein